MATSLLPTRPLSTPVILSLMPVLYHKINENCKKTGKNCLKSVYKLWERGIMRVQEEVSPGRAR
jgi:hypothetical protein